MPPVMDPYQQRALTTRVREPHMRTLPEQSDDMRELSVERCIHVYSVGPWQLQRNLGSWGTVTVPACPTERQWKTMDERERAKFSVESLGDHRYVRMNPMEPSLCLGVPGIFQEPVIHDEKEFMLAPVGQREGAMLVAKQVIGVGSHMSKHDSWVRFGVFIGTERGPKAKPTKKELESAEEVLKQTYWEYVDEAQQASVDGRINPNLVIDSEHHRLSALELGRTDYPWMSQVNPAERKDCPACGTKVNASVILCPQCRFVIDGVRYDEMVITGRIKDPDRYAQLNTATESAPQKKK